LGYSYHVFLNIQHFCLKKYREKVIDQEFKLDPTAEENLEFIFKDHPDAEVIKEVFKKAGTNNIRVIRKTKWLIDELIPLMDNWEDSLRHQIMRNCIIINLAKLDTKFCERFDITLDVLLPSRESSNAKTLQQMITINNLEYGYIEQIDELIIQFIETSLLKYCEFIEKGEICNQREKRNPIIHKLNEIGNSYYNSFANNEKEIFNKIITFLEEHYLDLSISEFEQIERYASDYASAMEVKVDISKYEKALFKKELIQELNYFNYSNTFRQKLSKYPDLEADFKKKIDEYHQTLDIATALNKIIYPYSKSILLGIEPDIEFLNSRTVDEYCQWLEEGHTDLYWMVKEFLNRRDSSASQKLEEAIRILAGKNTLNKIRAKSLYNIDIDNPSNANN
jgi:hypothetical protein